MKIFAIYVKNLFFLGTKCIGNCGCRRTTWPNFHPQTIRLTRLTGNQSSPFREDSAGNSTKVKDVLGVISNTPALNVEAITLPQNASRENQLSPPLALSHPVQLPTPVKVNRLHFYLDGYPTKLKDYLLNGFQHGFLLDYVGPHKPSSCKNLLSATQKPEAVADKLSKEWSLGRIAGPFLERPFSSLRISPLGLIPKKTPREFHLIHHLSFPHGDSINSCIPNDASCYAGNLLEDG